MRTHRYDWGTIRAEHEAGSSMAELSGRHGVDKAVISRRAKKEGWIQVGAKPVDRAAYAESGGTADPLDAQEKAAAITPAVDEKATVIIRHREEWDGQGRLIAEAAECRDMETAKLAKLVAETLKIRQEAERKAWGIRDVDAQPDGGVLTVRILRVSGE